MSLSAQLFRLEQLDSDIERIQTELAEGQRRLQRNPELEAAETRLDELRKEERAAAAEQRVMETDLADVEAKINRDQKRMYSGSIVDSRELASLERELGHYREQRGSLEEGVLLAMDRIEGMQSEIARLAARVAELRAAWEDERQTLNRQAEGQRETLAALRAERESAAGELDPVALNRYVRVRANAGHAVTQISDGVCGTCRVSLPAKDIQHARSGALVTCTNCSRILYGGS